MAVEDVIKLVKKVATEVIPDTITFTDVKVEASNVVLYTPNLEIFSDNNDLIRKLAQNVRKRIVIKADSSVRKPIIADKQRLTEILGKDFLVETMLNKRGKYGRVLGILHVENETGDRTNVNQQLVTEGHAVEYFGGART